MTWTILALLRWTTDYFAQRGVSEPRASAEVLLAHVLGTRRLDLYLRHDQPLTEAELARFKTLVQRRLTGEPTQYLTGHQEFWSLDLRVSPAVLIPRPETEVLLETVLDLIRRPDSPPVRWVLDLGTGSGALALALARELPEARVVAVDISPEALLLARQNARRHHVEPRLHLVRGDLCGPLKPGPGFQVIVSNPPYIPTADLPSLPPEIRDYEPRLALDGGPDGLAVLRRLAAQVHLHLAPGGLVALEVGLGQAPAVQALLAATAAYAATGCRPDYAGVDRVVWARRSGT